METTTKRSTSLIIINSTFRWIVLSLALLASLFKALDDPGPALRRFSFSDSEPLPIFGFGGGSTGRCTGQWRGIARPGGLEDRSQKRGARRAIGPVARPGGNWRTGHRSAGAGGPDPLT